MIHVHAVLEKNIRIVVKTRNKINGAMELIFIVPAQSNWALENYD